MAWAVFDWANSAFPAVIVTFVFAAYFTQGVAADTVTGTAQWGWAMSLSALAVALSAPVLGAVADQTGRRKPWLALFTALCVGATAALWPVEPDTAWVPWALVAVALANLAFESGMVFYNAMLADLAPPERIGRWSGWGWGLGYAGGVACLTIALLVFVQADHPPFGLDREQAEHVRAVAPLVALWTALFSLPLFLFTPDTPRTGTPLSQALVAGPRTLWKTLRNVRRHGAVARFLLARMIYIDGLNTLFAFGGVYAAGTFGMELAEVIQFGLALNVTAGIGSALFAVLDDRIGPKRVILISVGCLAVLGTGVLLVHDKALFWALGLALGLFVGPTQSASRSLMAHLAPADLRTEMFGLFALSGKATAWMGPAVLAWVTEAFASQRAGMGSILVFFAIGMALMAGVPDQRARPPERAD
ncbi:MAG: MFS transporter [Rhodobacterales bacterium]|nr:MFS transporter [Rhodobacterales bacterium]